MNKEQRKRITQNLTNLKERLVELDPIIDILIEKDVFTLQHRERIDQVTPATPQKKFNEFIQMLLASPEPNSYNVFIDALYQERLHYIAERLQNTVISGTSPMRNAHNFRDMRRSRVSSAFPSRGHDASGASGAVQGVGYANLESLMTQTFTNFTGKLSSDIVSAMQKQRTKERDELEARMDEKLNEFKKGWEFEKSSLLKMNESAIRNLETSVDKLRKSNEEYNRLQEMYDQLKQTQKEYREKESDRWQRLSQSNLENIHLKATNDNLKGTVKELKEKVKDLEEENRILKEKEAQSQVDVEHLSVENKTLIAELDEKERERNSLKKEVEIAYERIHDVVKCQREKSDVEDNSYKSALEKQSEKLNEIFEVVNSLTTREKSFRPPSRGLFVGGNTAPRSQRMQRNRNESQQ